jgi:hypothetical protein
LSSELLIHHKFVGKRFEDNGLDFDVLDELVAYRDIILELAEYIWKIEHPERERVKKRYLKDIQFKFFDLEKGSVVIPIQISTHSPQLFPFENIFKAADTFNETIESIKNGTRLPVSLPKSILPRFTSYGKSLLQDESYELVSPRVTSKIIRFDKEIREKFTCLLEKEYSDTIDVSGEIRETDLDGKSFKIRLINGKKISGKFSSIDQETKILKALDPNLNISARIIGTGSFENGCLEQIVEVKEVILNQPSIFEENKADTSIWKKAKQLADSLPEMERKKLPNDLAENHDRYLYSKK